MASFQKALVVQELGKPITLIERPKPKPKEGQVLVKVIAAGCT